MASGSKASGRAGGAKPPYKPDIGNQMVMLLAFMAAMFIMFDQGLRQGLGEIVGIPLSPLVGFDGQMPMLTLILTGLLMTFFSVTVRHLFVDWVKQAKSTRISSAFNKELREARAGNNTFKLKKLMEMQPQMMAQSLQASQTQFKLMPITMIVIIPIFAWLANFVYLDLASTSFSVPWEFNSDMRNSNVLPNWVLVYSLVTLPFGQVLQRVLKTYSFRKRLRDLENAPPQSLKETEGA
jgi:uncharacterized membrane protein (DUF106 family)